VLKLSWEADQCKPLGSGAVKAAAESERAADARATQGLAALLLATSSDGNDSRNYGSNALDDIRGEQFLPYRSVIALVNIALATS